MINIVFVFWQFQCIRIMPFHHRLPAGPLTFFCFIFLSPEIFLIISDGIYRKALPAMERLQRKYHHLIQGVDSWSFFEAKNAKHLFSAEWKVLFAHNAPLQISSTKSTNFVPEFPRASALCWDKSSHLISREIWTFKITDTSSVLHYPNYFQVFKTFGIFIFPSQSKKPLKRPNIFPFRN